MAFGENTRGAARVSTAEAVTCPVSVGCQLGSECQRCIEALGGHLAPASRSRRAGASRPMSTPVARCASETSCSGEEMPGDLVERAHNVQRGGRLSPSWRGGSSCLRFHSV